WTLQGRGHRDLGPLLALRRPRLDVRRPDGLPAERRKIRRGEITMTGTMREESLKTDIIVYVIILVIAGLQVLIAYRGGTIGQHVIEFLSLAIIQAGLGVMFFMHLFQEKRSLMFALIPATRFVLLMMNVIWSDSFRLIQMKPWPN